LYDVDLEEGVMTVEDIEDNPWLFELWWKGSNWPDACNGNPDQVDKGDDKADNDDLSKLVLVDYLDIEDGKNAGKGIWGGGGPPWNAFGNWILFGDSGPLFKAAPNKCWYIWQYCVITKDWVDPPKDAAAIISFPGCGKKRRRRR